MEYLNLDPQFEPFGTGINYKDFTFAGGELHIRIETDLKEVDQVTITARPRSFNDFGLILLASDALIRAGVKTLHLFIPYFPAARQDRVMVPGEPLSVKVYADLINSVGFESVTVFDPHSDVTPALLNNVRAIPNYPFVESFCENYDDYHLISPDGGALKKVHKLAQAIQANSVVECSKVRDVRTGKLKSFTAYTDDLEDKTCLVVDDICDGGGTFLGLADELKAKNAGKLVLVVSHGIFSKGFESLFEKYDEIYTTDSFRSFNEQRLNVVQLNQSLLK